MKLQNALLVVLTSGVLALNSYAAEPEKAAAPEVTQAKEHPKKMKKHSHMEEKDGRSCTRRKGCPGCG